MVENEGLFSRPGGHCKKAGLASSSVQSVFFISRYKRIKFSTIEKKIKGIIKEEIKVDFYSHGFVEYAHTRV